jgi:hypothetical protein
MPSNIALHSLTKNKIVVLESLQIWYYVSVTYHNIYVMSYIML